MSNDEQERTISSAETRLRLTVLVDHYPALSETFVLGEISSLVGLGHDVHVETAAWAEHRADRTPDAPAHCLDDDSLLARCRDLLLLVMRHPVSCFRDLRHRRRWAREEPVRPLRVIAPAARRIARRRTQHLHAHFAAGVALDALRMSRLLHIPYSVMSHAYDIYRNPRNLVEKLRSASFAGAECEYSASTLRHVLGPALAERVEVITMGVDHQYFARRSPLPGGQTVVAVGRLVEKKGLKHLLEACALLAKHGRIDALIVVGDGPQRDELHARARALGLDPIVQWRGAQGAAGVRTALEEADVVGIPAVPSADGDRDVLPLIAGEALAMELPVVASEYVGLPEIIRPPWGWLVPPGDAAALANALQHVLSLPTEERRRLGRAGRDYVVATRDNRDAAMRLTELIRSSDRQRLTDPATQTAQTTGVR